MCRDECLRQLQPEPCKEAAIATAAITGRLQANSRDECKAVKDFTLYKISAFDSTDAGAIRMYHAFSSKEDNIMNEIYKHGPVSCTLFATDNFDEYTGGIYSENGIRWNANHIVSLVGWGEENGIP